MVGHGLLTVLITGLTIISGSNGLPAAWVRSLSAGTNPYVTFQCGDQPDGYYADTVRGCRLYFICSGGRKYSYYCPPGMIFDVPGRKCSPKDGVACGEGQEQGQSEGQGQEEVEGQRDAIFSSFLTGRQMSLSTDECVYLPDGYYGNTLTRCKSYYKCEGAKKTETFTCKRGRVFDESHVACVMPSSDTVCGQHLKPITAQIRQIKFKRLDTAYEQLDRWARLLGSD